jgi:1,4-alpha-glucan branching enzyme
MASKRPKLLRLLQNDPWLEPFSRHVADRFMRFHNLLFQLEDQFGSLYEFAGGHHYFGLNYDPVRRGWIYREWAPAAESLHLIGDFNHWDRSSHPLQKVQNPPHFAPWPGIWEIFLADTAHALTFTHGSLFKVLVKSKAGTLERIPAYIRRVVQNEETKDFAAQVWKMASADELAHWAEQWQQARAKLAPLSSGPEVGGPLAKANIAGAAAPSAWTKTGAEAGALAEAQAKLDQAILQSFVTFDWQGDDFALPPDQELLIYECHVGMAQERAGLGTYREFADLILPRIKAGGYNAIQLMAIHEHPYYGSFGYHVSSFFAPSSRFGTPEDLKYLVRTAHQMGIAVIMDIVHSHAVKNVLEGLNFWDGTDFQYFHSGGRGDHPLWDSKLFNYSKWEVLQFLLSNVRYWLEEFHFDGYRFDGVTSMLYYHHGNVEFNVYADYFNDSVDKDAVTYLQLANALVHQVRPGGVSIAEDVSGMPGLGAPIGDGGLGFDYRLGMGIPDYWIKLVKEKLDEQWDIGELYHTMLNRRADERTVAYAESHDQALVGDKTLAFRLMDKEMYTNMAVDHPSLVVDRGVALHKLIRLFTIALGGEAYLNFMGNEFGHPEWIDFPREGNGWSYQHARRQWSLVDNPNLRYQQMGKFDQAMIELAKKHYLLAGRGSKQEKAVRTNLDSGNKVVCFAKGGLVFVFNFHPSASIPDYKFWVPEPGKYQIVLNSDDAAFGGHGRVEPSTEFFTDEEQFLSIYCTNRTALVFQRVD